MSDENNVPVRHRTRDTSAPRADMTRPRGGEMHVLRSGKPKEDPQITALKQYQSRQIEDPFANHYMQGDTGHQVIEPPYNFSALVRLPRENSMLRQCIDAMVTNTEGHGWRLEYVGEEGQEQSAEAQAEKERLENLLEYPNGEQSITEIRERVRRDLETLGNAYIEVGLDGEGRVSLIAHVPGETVRICYRDKEPVEVSLKLPREGTAETQKVSKRFRRYVQRVANQTIYFKEWGDPRDIDAVTGEVLGKKAKKAKATQLVHLSLYHPGSAYGAPRWMNQMPSILGSRQAELTNLDYFQENAIPAMVVSVSGGMLTETALENLESHITAARGREATNRVIVVEAQGDREAVGPEGQIPPPRIEIKPLTADRPQDGLFLEYDERCSRKVRSAFRLPPLFVGHADDYSHATAKASYEVAESQVFGPERRRSDDVFNRLLETYDPKYWEFRSNPPRITDPTDVISAVTTFDAVGAMTPNTAVGLANEYFDLDIEEIAEDWGNWPFAIVQSLAGSGKLKGLEEIMEQLEPVMPEEPKDEDDDEDTPPVPEEGDFVEEEEVERIHLLRRTLKGLFNELKTANEDTHEDAGT